MADAKSVCDTTGGWCCGTLVTQKVCLNITVTCPYVLYSKKASMLFEGPMMLVRSAIKKVSVKYSLNPCMSALGVDGFLSSPLSRRLVVTGHINFQCLMMVPSRLSVRLRKILAHSLLPRRSCWNYALLRALSSLKIPHLWSIVLKYFRSCSRLLWSLKNLWTLWIPLILLMTPLGMTYN